MWFKIVKVRVAYSSPVILLRSTSSTTRKNFVYSSSTFLAGLSYKATPSLALRASRPRSIYAFAT
jgi:hypothetical protein